MVGRARNEVPKRASVGSTTHTNSASVVAPSGNAPYSGSVYRRKKTAPTPTVMQKSNSSKINVRTWPLYARSKCDVLKSICRARNGRALRYAYRAREPENSPRRFGRRGCPSKRTPRRRTSTPCSLTHSAGRQSALYPPKSVLGPQPDARPRERVGLLPQDSLDVRRPPRRTSGEVRVRPHRSCPVQQRSVCRATRRPGVAYPRRSAPLPLGEQQLVGAPFGSGDALQRPFKPGKGC